MLHEGTLFQFRFTPQPGAGLGTDEVNDLIDTVSASFGFIPAPFEGS
jgi:hypothetical protein